MAINFDPLMEIEVIKNEIIDAFEKNKKAHLLGIFKKLDALVSNMLDKKREGLPFDPLAVRRMPVMEDDGVA